MVRIFGRDQGRLEASDGDPPGGMSVRMSANGALDTAGSQAGSTVS